MTPHNQPKHDTLRFAGDAVFRQVRGSLHELGFNEETLRERYFFKGIPGDLAVFPRASQKPAGTLSSLDVLVHLFLGEEPLPAELVTERLGETLVSALRAADIIRIDDDSFCRPSIRLEPFEDLLVCADLVLSGSSRRSDFVYRSWDFSAQSYARMVPLMPCGSFLEMCCGSAYICLRMARSFAESVCGVDSNPRAIHFAEFNRRLNGIDRVVELHSGDLFAPIAGRTFDRIVAHPPYMPARDNGLMYKDGGPDGEQISSRLLRALPQHLSEEGSFHGFLLLSDRKDAPAEARVREMLGADEHLFDVALLTMLEETPAAFLSERPDPDFFSKTNESLREAARILGIVRFVKAFLTIRRRRGIVPVTIRHRATGWETIMRMSELPA